ncbi:uncharacterized protein LOC141639965 [Silene latifolia]|uniref:uncharacterized protein LOC141639965 n=1 Tax=Silene latifolia TaxID=37657 RepID=UPI003D76C316
MEYLSRILDRIEDYVPFRYHPLCGRIKLNHLAFADDLLIFCKGDRMSITGLIRAFKSFSRASGLKMNKSIPIAATKLSVLECSSLVDKVPGRIRSLGCRKLSYAGRLVLIQSVLSNLHTYWARIFILPTSILKQIVSIYRIFLWTGLDNDHGKALVA